MSPDDPEPLADDLVTRMAEFDEQLAGGSDPPHRQPAAGPGGESRWEELAGCLRRLRRAFPGTPPHYPGQPTGTFGRFHIRREVGRGGFGVVFLADDPLLHRPVALKLPRPDAVADPGLRARFLREARAAAALDHPGIVPVYEAGEVGPVCYIAAAFCPGTDLARWLKGRTGPVAAKTAAALLADIADAAHHAHSHGILHRDLKPSNILLEPAPAAATGYAPRITDFGLARLLEADADQTSSGVVLGTPVYMAPEQAEGRGDRVAAPTDVYALGVILYEVLTGILPSRGGSLLQTLEQVRSGWPVPVRRLRPDVPRDLETVCLKCLHKEPARRYATAADLAADLRRFLAGQPVRARPVGSAELAWFWARRNPALASLAAAVLGLLLLTAAVSVGAAVRLAASAEVARAAERDATEKLFRSSVAQARALRLGGYVGQRYDSLRALRQASVSARAIGLGPDELLEARNEAIAALALSDFRVDREWEGHPDGSNGIGFDSRFERYARSSRDGTISVRRVADDAELSRLTSGAADDATARVALRFGGGDRFLTAWGNYSRGRTLSVWELEAGGGTLRMRVEAAEGLCDVTPDGRALVTGLTGGAVGVFDLATGKLARRLTAAPAPFQFAVDPAGRRVAVSGEQAPGVRVLDLATGAVLREFRHEPNAEGLYCHGVAWDPAGRTLAVGGCDHRVYLWDTETGARLRTLDGHFWELLSVAFDRTGERLISAGLDRTDRLWDVRTGRQLLAARARFVALAGDDRLALMPDARHVRVGTPTPGRGCRTLHIDRGTVDRGRFTGDGRTLAVKQRGVHFWDAESGRKVGSCAGTNTADFLFEPGGGLLTYEPDGVRRWPLRPGPGGRVEAGEPVVIATAAAPDDLMSWLGPPGRAVVLSEGRRRVRVLDLDRPGESAVLDADFPGVRFVDGSPDGRWAAAGVWEGTEGLRVYDVPGRRVVKEWRAGIVVPQFSPDGRWLAVSTGSLAPAGAAVSLWRVGTWEPVCSWPADRTSSPAFCDFSPDGRLLVFQCSMTDLRMVDTRTFRELATLRSPDPLLLDTLTFSPDGTRLASTTCQDAVHVWDLRELRAALGEIGLDWETRD